jgi:energy-coupling factor transporter ATP-binding protein EcfA2
VTNGVSNNEKPLRTIRMHRIRIFLASPCDVAEERDLAREVIDRLRNEFRYKDRIHFEIVAWDQPGAGVAQEAILTPQDAIAKGLPIPAECDLVLVLFWSRMGTPLPAEYTKLDGSRYLSGTEWEYCNAMQAARQQGIPRVWLYRRTQAPNPAFDDPDYEKIKQQWQRVEAFFQAFSAEDEAILGGVNSYNDATDFKTQFEDHLRGWLERRLAALEPQGQVIPEPRANSIEWKKAPYPGLRAFLPNEAPIFFGRRQETAALIELLAQPEGRFVAVVGASGSGKSSLVAAGLLPALQDNAIPGSSRWLDIRCKPAELDDNPFMALAVQLTPHLEKKGWRTGELAAQLAAMPSLLTERLGSQLHEAQDTTGELLLVIDQFEELFTRCHPRYLGPFIQLITMAAETAHFHVVITLRADYYRNCVDWPELTALLNQGAYSLPAPGVIALLDMIREPARLADLSLENGLADRMLQDAGDTPGRMALVAFALERLYEMGKQQRRLTHRAYEAFDGVRGAIAKKAEDTYRQLQKTGLDMETAFGRVFRELATIDPERNVATRKRAPLTAFVGEGAELKDVMVEARLLVSDQGKVEVAHEVLFQSWPRLKEWIDTVDDDLRLHERVRSEAKAWAAAGHDPYHLWSHERLVPVYEMFERLDLGRETLEEPLKSFIRPEAERLLAELEQPETSHYRRAEIGDRLDKTGDPRKGVGVDAHDIPQIEWIEVPAGHVVLENNAGSQDVDPFFIAKYPLTYRQYRAFVDAEDGYRNKQWWGGLHRHEAPGEQYRPIGNHPAENLSWYDAMAFCRWLSKKLGYAVRLPTEFERQQAATAGNPDHTYPWGGEWNGSLANTHESHLGRTTAVGMYPQGGTGGKPAGAQDMAGNEWEWCLNKYDHPDDTGIGGDEKRVCRGGSWFNGQYGARASYRYYFNPYDRYFNLGFRLCCEAPIP